MMVLLDTNIVIEHFKNGLLEEVVGDVNFAVSVITVAELLRLPGIGNNEISSIQEFISITKVIDVDYAIAERAASIGRTSKTKLPDLLIAATCLEYRVPLITKNLKDYVGISSLEVRDHI